MALVGRAVDSGFHQFDVNYEQAKQLAIGTALESEVFSAGGHQWRIKVYPRGCVISDNGAYLSIYLVLLNKAACKTVSAFFEAFLMDKNGQPPPAAARSEVRPLQTCSWGWPRFMPVDNLEAYVSEGFVSILFAVVVVSDNSIPVSPSEVGKHLGTLLDSMDGADVLFTIDGKTFQAHRVVLAARSPVFRAELYGSISEGTTLSITLHGIAPETFRRLLAFIYTDSLAEDHDNVPATEFHNLFAAADRYALDRLKLLCAQKLLDDVTLDTVVTTLTCAEMYNCPELKNKCLDFIAVEANDNFMLSEDYIQLALNFPCIIPDLRQRRFNSGYQQQHHHHLRPSDMALVGQPMDSKFHLFDVEYDQAKQLTIGTAMYSAALSVGGHSWRVNLYPCGRDVADNGEFMSIYLEHLSKAANKSVNAFFEFILMDKDGQPLRAGARSGVILFHKQEWGWPWFISLTDLKNNHITQDRFRFMCAITVITDSSIRVPPSDLGKQLGMLLESTEGTDVSFVIAGETFCAHRAVLAARSPVFRAELLGTMAEATMPSITIHEISPTIFRIMLRFIYTDALPGDDELGDSPVKMLICLLAASGRYALDRLKLWCASKLWDRVTVNTVSSALILSDMHSCLELKEKCLDFIVTKDAAWSVYLTDSYVQLIRKCPHLGAELQGRHEHLVAELRGRHG